MASKNTRATRSMKCEGEEDGLHDSRAHDEAIEKAE